MRLQQVVPVHCSCVNQHRREEVLLNKRNYLLWYCKATSGKVLTIGWFVQSQALRKEKASLTIGRMEISLCGVRRERC